MDISVPGIDRAPVGDKRVRLVTALLDFDLMEAGDSKFCTVEIKNKMDNDRLIGSGKQVAGRAEELFGKLVGEAKLQVDGKTEQVEGKVQNAAGGVKDALRK